MSVRKGGQLIAGSVDPDKYAKTDLSNLDATGQAKFDAKANVDLNNLSTAGQDILNGKADINASNFTAAGKQNIVGWGMPNYNAPVDITAAVAAGYTAEYKQYVAVQCVKNAVETSVSTLKLNNIVYNIASTSSNNQWHESNTLFLMLDVGDTIMTNSTNAGWFIVAYPLKGA